MHEIIFDLFGTLIEKEQYDYDKALNWLADSYFKHRFQELQELSSIFKKSYMEKRRVSCIESSFKDQLIFFEKELGIHIPVDYGTIEVDFINHFKELFLCYCACTFKRSLDVTADIFFSEKLGHPAFFKQL